MRSGSLGCSPRDRWRHGLVILIVGWSFIVADLLVSRSARIVSSSGSTCRCSARVSRGTALLLALRHVGIVLLALAFFLFWTLIYIGVWRWHPAGAFQGLPHTPTFSDFFYYAVSTAFVRPPGDITAASKGARTATMIELLTGTAALAAYLGSFLEFGSGAAAAVTEQRPPSSPSDS